MNNKFLNDAAHPRHGLKGTTILSICKFLSTKTSTISYIFRFKHQKQLHRRIFIYKMSPTIQTFRRTGTLRNVQFKLALSLPYFDFYNICSGFYDVHSMRYGNFCTSFGSVKNPAFDRDYRYQIIILAVNDYPSLAGSNSCMGS